MTEEELFCAKHGPYDKSKGVCPWCSDDLEGRPVPPSPLVDDAASTVPPPRIGSGSGTEAETQPPRRSDAPDYDDEATIMPGWAAGRGPDDIDATIVDRPQDTGILGWLIVNESQCFRRGHVWKLKPGSVYGRDPRRADEVIDDEKASGLHARIKLEEDEFKIFDLGSQNGTFVNGERIEQVTALKQDDQIRIGDTVFVLKTLLPPAAA